VLLALGLLELALPMQVLEVLLVQALLAELLAELQIWDCQP